jgi:hypothetical protein
MMTNPPKTSEAIAAKVAEESPQLAKLLVLAVRKDGSSFSFDNGLTVDEAKTMSVHFNAWLDKYSGQTEDTN